MPLRLPVIVEEHLMRGILVGMVMWAWLSSLAQAQGPADNSPPRILPPIYGEQCPSLCPNLACPPDASPTGIPPRLTLRHDFGDGVGYTRGFSYLEGFIPLDQPTDQSLLFGDLRVVNFDDQNRWEFNAGGGYRDYADPLDAVWGVNAFYDGRHTDHHFFHQVGIGAEALFKRWEFRCNGYFIVGENQKLASESVVPAVVGSQLIFDRIRVREVAMGGLDAEFGVRLPVLTRFDSRIYAGFYHYSAEGMQSANGVRGRLEAWPCDYCSIHFAIQNDGLFDTTVNGGLALHFGARHARSDPDAGSVESRLGQRVVRDVDIVIAQRADHDRYHFALKPAVDPPKTTGDPPPATGGASNPSTKDPCGSQPPCQPLCQWYCLPFPGAPGNPATFPGHHFPPGFHHDCFPGLGRYKYLGVDHYTTFCQP